MKAPLLTPKTFPLPPATVTPLSAEIDSPNEEKHSFNRGWIVWPVVILGFYILSSGPVLVSLESWNKWPTSTQILSGPYKPVGWAYRKTPLHKPLGLYLHLWLPLRFDRNGEPESPRGQ